MQKRYKSGGCLWYDGHFGVQFDERAYERKGFSFLDLMGLHKLRREEEATKVAVENRRVRAAKALMGLGMEPKVKPTTLIDRITGALHKMGAMLRRTK